MKLLGMGWGMGPDQSMHSSMGHYFLPEFPFTSGRANGSSHSGLRTMDFAGSNHVVNRKETAEEEVDAKQQSKGGGERRERERFAGAERSSFRLENVAAAERWSL